ncbi:copper-containing nitrite reductase [Kiloniella sp. b19]|uniref:copper-containing nitrite reductase n=1 Tax=Kiloniella sp. GXU_MW_B19 TaxID=3141326 RepID=UPI0031DFE18B
MTSNNMMDMERRAFMKLTGSGLVAAGASGLTLSTAVQAKVPSPKPVEGSFFGQLAREGYAAADPAVLPGPVTHSEPRTHDIELIAELMTAEIMPGVTSRFMTFNGQIPAPMIRVRQGDRLNITVTNLPGNEDAHSMDFHASFGTGGGAAFTEVVPGQSKKLSFTALFPGAFIYHCGVSNLDEHISRGMFGMIVVEPEEGLPPVDREFYLGQHELYTRERFGVPGETGFDARSMVAESPNYVLFNGAAGSFTAGALGTMKANVGETVRVFFVSGGPNKISSFHPIGNIWKRCWPQGALANAPLEYVQTWPVCPGSCFVGDMELPIPQLVTLVDHSVSRVVHKGLVAQIEVLGDEDPAVFSAG